MAEYLAAVVGRKTALPDGYRRHAAHQGMTLILEDWEQAHAILGRQIAELRKVRDDRQAEKEAGTWPCTHESSTGVDQDFGPDKVWACDGCGWRHRTVVAGGLARDVDA